MFISISISISPGKSGLLFLAVGLVGTVLIGCSDSESVAEHKPQSIEAGDTCHLCGMIIENHPGPKGQLYVKGDNNVRRFCSTRDLFAWMLQPENKPNIAEIYVHDMYAEPWQAPNDKAFIDARKAWYVAGSNQKGAMGPTLASFAEKSAAESFIRNFGGYLLRFEEVTLQVVNTLPGHNI